MKTVWKLWKFPGGVVEYQSVHFVVSKCEIYIQSGPTLNDELTQSGWSNLPESSSANHLGMSPSRRCINLNEIIELIRTEL